MKYYIKCKCRNCKTSFKIEIDETRYRETNRKALENNCFFHRCINDEIVEHGIADTVAYCKEKD